MEDRVRLEEMEEIEEELEEDPLSLVSVDLDEDREDLEQRLNLQKCPVCEKTFGNKMSLNLHRLKEHGGEAVRSTSCPICGESPEEEDLTTHCRREHGIEGVVCPICTKILSKTCTLNRHIEQVHLNLQIHKPARCHLCGKVFSKKGHLDRHIRTIHMGLKEASNPCPLCGKIFSTKSSLEPHIEMVHKGVRRQCPNCGKVLSDLWKHMRTVHGFYRRKAKIPREAPPLLPSIPDSVPEHVREIIRDNVLNGSVTIVRKTSSDRPISQ